MKAFNILAFALLAMFIVCCDEGDIQPKPYSSDKGTIVKLVGRMDGISSWTSKYSIVLAGFKETSNYSVVQKQISSSVDSTETIVTLSITADSIETIELAAVDVLRLRIATFASISIDEADGDTLYFNIGTINVGMYDAIQNEIFSASCTSCHGGSNYAAADLVLTEEGSYESLVGISSTRITDAYRVKAGSADESVLYNVIAGKETSLSFDHSNMITEQRYLKLVERWINNLTSE